MKTLLLLAIIVFCSSQTGISQPVENVFLITLDGLRWEELYSGADEWLLDNKKYSSNPERLKEKYWRESPIERREILMPFFWSTIKDKGQLIGNRNLGSNVEVANNQVFSYPGYNEILTGFADSTITSNDKVPNKNVTVLEWVNDQQDFKGKVGAFASWDVFPYIINEGRSGVPVNAGFDIATDDPNEKEQWINRMQLQTPSPWSSVRLDVFTHNYALEYLEQHRPKLLYIAYGETDDFAHDSDYDQYLNAAQRTDAFIEELWNWVESQEDYRGKTAFVITTDHGRGKEDRWTGHGTNVIGSTHIWIALLGAGVESKGEVKSGPQLFQNQIASTVADLLGLNYSNRVPVGTSILK